MRYSFDRGDHMEVGFHLIFNRSGDVRLTRGQPGMASDERSMAVNLKVPHALFKVPVLSAQIAISEPTGGAPEIDITAAEEALSEALGARVEITVKEAS